MGLTFRFVLLLLDSPLVYLFVDDRTAMVFTFMPFIPLPPNSLTSVLDSFFAFNQIRRSSHQFLAFSVWHIDLDLYGVQKFVY